MNHCTCFLFASTCIDTETCQSAHLTCFCSPDCGTTAQICECDANEFQVQPCDQNATAPAAVVDSKVAGNVASGLVTITGAWSEVPLGSPDSSGARGTAVLSDGDAGKGSKSVLFALRPARAGRYRVGLTYLAGFDRATRVPVTVAHADGRTTVEVDQRAGYAPAAYYLLGTFRLDPGNASSSSVLVENRGTDVNTDNAIGNVVTADAAVLEAVALDAVCTAVQTCAAGTSYETAAPTATTDRVCATATACTAGTSYETAAPTATTDRACAPVTAACRAGQVETAAPTATTDRACGAAEADCGPCAAGQYQAQACETNATAVAEAAPAAVVDSEVAGNVASGLVTITGAWSEVPLGSPDSSGARGTAVLSDGDAGKGSKSVLFALRPARAGRYRVGLTYLAGFDRATRVPVTVAHADGRTTVEVDQRAGYAPAAYYLLGTFRLDPGNASSSSVLVENRGTDVNTDNAIGNIVVVDSVVLEPVTLDVDCRPCSVCIAYQQQCTKTADALCFPNVNFTHASMIELSLSSSVAFFEGAVEAPSGDASSRSLAALVNRPPNSIATVTASLGTQFTATRNNIVGVLAAPVTFEAVLQTPDVWRDQRTVRVAFQVKDSRHNVQSSARGMSVRVVPSAGLRAREDTEPSGSCTTSTSTGLCTATVTLPAAWVDFDGTETVRVDVAFAAGSPDWAPLDTAQVHAQAAVTVEDHGIGRLPARSLFRGNTFDIPFSVDLPRLTKNYQLVVTVDAGLALQTMTFDQSRWAGGFLLSDDKLSGTVVNLLTNDALVAAGQAGPVAGEEELLTIRVAVANNAPEDTLLQVNISIVEMGDVAGNNLRPGGANLPQLARMFDRTGVSATGRVFVAANALRGILPSVGTGELINTAQLDGKRVSTAVTVRGVYLQSGIAGVSLAGAACQSANPQAVQVEPGCGAVFVDGSETLEGLDEVTIAVRVAGFTANMSVAVWSVALPVTVELERPVLRRIRGWPDAASPNCTLLRWQDSGVRVAALFVQSRAAGGGQVNRTVDVTPLVQAQLASNDTDVAEVVEGSVRGRGLGTAAISVASPQQNAAALGQTVVQGSAELARVVGLDAVVLKAGALSVQVAPQSVARLGTATATARVARDATLTFEGDEAFVVVSAVFDDLTRLALGREHRVVVTSLAAQALQVDQDRVFVPVRGESAAGALVGVAWQPAEECGLQDPVATATADVTVELPKALSASISVSVRTLASTADAAAAAGIATTSTFSVTLLYPGNRVVDATQDSRTQYDLSQTGNLFTVSAAQKRITANGALALGTGALSVAFEHENVTASVTVTVIGFEALEVWATPYPTYPQSDQDRITSLTSINGTDPVVYQQALLNVRMLLSNGQRLNIETRGDVTFQVRARNSSAASSLVQVQGAGNRDVLTPAGQAGVADIVVLFAGKESAEALTVTVSDAGVGVRSIDSVQLDAGSVLRGAVDVASSLTRVSVTLTDGRRYTSLFTGSTPAVALPGLVAFRSSHPAAVSVAASTGRARLHGNLAELATVTAVIASAGLERATAGFACNLDPTFGDVDLGQASGIPLPSRTVGAAFDVDLRVGSQGVGIGGFEMQVLYDASVLRVDGASALFDGGTFASVVNPPGVLTFSGAVGAAGSAAFSLCRVRFTALQPGTSNVTGVVVSLGQNTASPTPLGTPAGRAFVAGDNVQVVRSARRELAAPTAAGRLTVDARDHLAAVQAALTRQRARRQTCTLADDFFNPGGCSNPTACAAPELGDTNGDCVFDANDIGFVLLYLLESGLQFQSARGQQMQALFRAEPHTLRAIDADLDTQRNSLDMSFLNFVNLGILHHVGALAVAPVSAASGCELVINVTLLGKGDKAPAAGAAAVFVDLGHASAAFQAQFDASVFLQGTVQTRNKGTGLHGGVVAAEEVAPGVFVVRSAAAVQLAQIGLVLIQATTYSAAEPTYRVQQFMDGLDQSPYAFTGAYTAAWTVFGHANAVAPARSAYNPLRVFDNPDDTVTCKLAAGTCDALPCSSGQYLNGSCTLLAESLCVDTTQCFAGELELVAPSATSDRICAAANVSHVDLFTFSSSEPSFFVYDQIPDPDPSASTRPVGFFVNDVSQPGSVQVVATGSMLSATLPFGIPPEAAETLQAHLLQSTFYLDARTVSVAVQVQAADGSSRVQPTAVRLRIVAPDTLKDALDIEPTASCTTNDQGLCVASATLPAEWLMGTGAENCTVFARLSSFPTPSEQLVGDIMLQRWTAANVTALRPSVVAQFPVAPIRTNQAFAVQLTAATDLPLDSFRIQVRGSAGVRFEGALVDAQLWTGQQAQVVSPPALSMSYIAATASGGRDLGSVRVTVMSSNTAEFVNVTVLYLSDVTQNPLVTSAEAAVHLDLRALEFGGTVPQEHHYGTVTGVPNDIAAVFAVTPAATLANFAVLNNQTQSLPLSLMGVRELGQIVSLSSGITCRTSEPQVLGVRQDCQAVVMDSQATRGADQVSVFLQFDGRLDAEARFAVWFPTAVVAQLDRSVLQPLLGRFTQGNCSAPEYTSARLSVFANYSHSAGDTWLIVDVSTVVQGSLVSANPRVAVVADGGVVLAVGAGSTTVGLAQARARISVSNHSAPARPVLLDVSLASSMVLESEPTPAEHAAVFEAQAHVAGADLRYPGDRAYVLVNALLDDLTRWPVDDVILEVNDTGLVTLEGHELVVAPFATGGTAELTVTLTSHCSRGENITGTLLVPVRTPAPLRLSVSVSSTEVTTLDDAASRVGVATSVRVSVALVYSDRQLDVTDRDDTVLELSGGHLALATSGGRVIVANASSPGGTGVVTVRSVVFGLVAQVSVQVVRSVGLEVQTQPEPSYPGSQSRSVVALHPIAGTTPTTYQQARLTLTLLLSNSNRADVSSVSGAAVNVTAVHTDGDTETRTQTSLVVGVPATAVPAAENATSTLVSLAVVGLFEGWISSVFELRVAHNDTVFVVSLDNLALAAGSTLRGVSGEAGSDVRLGVTLSDGTHYPTLFPGGETVLPGLVQFKENPNR